METISQFVQVLHPQFFIAAGLGALIGLEREISGKDPSLRTFALISLGSCIFAMLSISVAASATEAQRADPARIAAQIIPGIGFIGAGTIFKSTRGVSGLTTAALMWTTAGIGMAVGMGYTEFAVEGTGIALTVTLLLRIVHRIVRPFRRPAENNGSISHDI